MTPRTRRPPLLALLAAATPALALGADEPLSLEGFSGLLHTPSAWVHAAGSAHLLGTEAADPRFWGGRSRTFVASLGLFRLVELGGRITDAHGPRARARDLSANLKLQLPLEWLARRPLPFAVAVGTQDEGGAAPHFRTRYAVASARAGPLSLSAGYGSGPDRMEGVFGGAAVRVTRFAELLGDYDARRWSAGVRVGADLSVLGAPLRLALLGSRTLARGAPDVEWAAELTIPLGPRAEAERPDPRPVPAAEPAPPCGPSLPVLLDALVGAGFENVRIGRDGDAVVVEYENDVYRHAEADGLGVVLGLVARDAPATLARFRVRLLRAQLAVLEVAGPTAALRAYFLRSGEAAPPLGAAMAVRVRPGAHYAEWLEPRVRRWTGLRPRIGVGPGLRTLIATEIGVLEHVLSVRPEVVLPLWPGATGYVRWDVPIAVSSQYRSSGALHAYRPEPMLLEALVHQAVAIAPGVTALAGAGVIDSSRDGGLAQLLWTSPGGGHAVGVEGAATHDVLTSEQGTSVTGSYRTRLPRLDTGVEVRAGRFLAGDHGFTAKLSRFFGDTGVAIFVQRTELAMVGFELSLPLSPRREMAPGLAQLRGDNRWSHAVATVVGERANPIVTGAAAPPLTRLNLRDAFFDRGRLDREQLLAALPRARAAFLRDASREARCAERGRNR